MKQETRTATSEVANNQCLNDTLIVFILHSENINSVHYKAYKKQKERVCSSDSTVTKITEKDAKGHAKEAYVFFYQPNQTAVTG